MNEAQSMCGPLSVGGGEDQRAHGTWATLCELRADAWAAICWAWAGATAALTVGLGAPQAELRIEGEDQDHRHQADDRQRVADRDVKRGHARAHPVVHAA